MDNNKQSIFKQPLQLIWIWVSFCMYVCFHLLPSYVTGGLFTLSVGTPTDEMIMLIWTYFGIGLVGTFIGYRSRGITVFEPAIASLLYIIVLSFTLPHITSLQIEAGKVPHLLLAFIAAFVVAAAGGALGEILQARKAKKLPAQA